jgi:hypothetical protein
MSMSFQYAQQYVLFDQRAYPNVPNCEILPPSTLRVGAHALPTSPVFASYWRLAYERQEILFRRLRGEPAPWTADPILLKHKFTNAYRAADRTSQFLIRQVIYRPDLPDSPEEIVFRILLFKLFNKIETWQYLEHTCGQITFKDYSFARYDTLLSGLLAANRQIYSAAYMMPPGGREFGHPRKHQNHLMLLERMMADQLPDRISHANSLAAVFALLRAYPTIGDFLAYQYAIDLNYSPIINFSENDFVVAGPGARDGIEKCFPNTNGVEYTRIIHAMMEQQTEHFQHLGLTFQSLWNRPLQLIDCQNLFCEVSKYARVKHPTITGSAGRTRIKQLYSAKPSTIDFFFPPKWQLNVASY